MAIEGDHVTLANNQGEKVSVPAVVIYNADGTPVGGDGAGAVTTQIAASSSLWRYAAAASGIVNTTAAVTIATAAGAGVRNYLSSLQIVAEALGAATELVVRDGAGGTVLWRIKLGVGGLTGGLSITFPAPLRGSANTLLEVATLTASVTGAVYVNAQGYTGA